MPKGTCRVLVALFGSTSMLLGCNGKNPFAPGEPIGTYRVTGALKESSCGNAPDPWTFEVRLAKDPPSKNPTDLHWLTGGPAVSATLSSDGKAAFEWEETRTLRESKGRSAGCVVTRHDSMTLVLASDLASFQAELTYRFTPLEGSACNEELSPEGGDFDALPCATRHALSGVRITEK